MFEINIVNVVTISATISFSYYSTILKHSKKDEETIFFFLKMQTFFHESAFLEIIQAKKCRA